MRLNCIFPVSVKHSHTWTDRHIFQLPLLGMPTAPGRGGGDPSGLLLCLQLRHDQKKSTAGTNIDEVHLRGSGEELATPLPTLCTYKEEMDINYRGVFPPFKECHSKCTEKRLQGFQPTPSAHLHAPVHCSTLIPGSEAQVRTDFQI